MSEDESNTIPIEASKVPLGPKGPPPETPFSEYLSFNILQVSRDDLVKWIIAAATEDADLQVLGIDWKDGSAHSFLKEEAGDPEFSSPIATKPAEIEQVEEVASVSFSTNYPDDSRLHLRLNRGSVSLQYAAEQHNSLAQHRVFAVRNLIEKSEAVRAPRFSIRPFIPSIIILLIGVLTMGAAVTLSSRAVTSPGERGGVVVINESSTAGFLGVLLAGVALAVAFAIFSAKSSFFRRAESITDPMVISYPQRSRLTPHTIFGVVVGVFGIIGAIAAVIVIFYSPK